MTVRVFGIKSCDTCRKACKWLAEQSIKYQWSDLREQAPGRETLQRWLDAAGVERLVNRRSSTWCGLDDQHRPALDSPELLHLLLEQPTLVKRPVFERTGEIRVGFDEVVRRWLLQV